jgi:hypothetical protein
MAGAMVVAPTMAAEIVVIVCLLGMTASIVITMVEAVMGRVVSPAITVVVLLPIDLPTGLVELALQRATLEPVEMPIAPELPFQVSDVSVLLAQDLGLVAGQVATSDAMPDARVLSIQTTFDSIEAVVIATVIGQGRRAEQAH